MRDVLSFLPGFVGQEVFQQFESKSQSGRRKDFRLAGTTKKEIKTQTCMKQGAFVPVPFFNIGKEACKFMIVAVIAITNIFVIDGSAAVHSLTLQRSTLNGDVHHPSGQMNNNSWCPNFLCKGQDWKCQPSHKKPVVHPCFFFPSLLTCSVPSCVGSCLSLPDSLWWCAVKHVNAKFQFFLLKVALWQNNDFNSRWGNLTVEKQKHMPDSQEASGKLEGSGLHHHSSWLPGGLNRVTCFQQINSFLLHHILLGVELKAPDLTLAGLVTGKLVQLALKQVEGDCSCKESCMALFDQDVSKGTCHVSSFGVVLEHMVQWWFRQSMWWDALKAMKWHIIDWKCKWQPTLGWWSGFGMNAECAAKRIFFLCCSFLRAMWKWLVDCHWVFAGVSNLVDGGWVWFLISKTRFFPQKTSLPTRGWNQIFLPNIHVRREWRLEGLDSLARETRNTKTVDFAVSFTQTECPLESCSTGLVQ